MITPTGWLFDLSPGNHVSMLSDKYATDNAVADQQMEEQWAKRQAKQKAKDEEHARLQARKMAREKNQPE